MITFDDMRNAENALIEYWGEIGKSVVMSCRAEHPYDGTFTEYLDECFACGGNLGGMLLTGIKSLYPAVWDIIPNQMGPHAFECLADVLILLGVDTSK